MVNFVEATDWLSKSQAVELQGGIFEPCSTKERLKRFVSSEHHNQQLLKITSFVQEKLLKSEGVEQQRYLQLAAALIKSEPNNAIVRLFDREIVKLRPEFTFEQADNQADYQKWQRYGLPDTIFRKHPEFCRFMQASGLDSQLKVTRDRLREIDSEPALLVKGEWMTWPELKAQFEPVYSKRYRETFLVHKETSEVYTYLDNGLGLEPHHPYLTENTPTSLLTDNDYAKVRDKAQLFIRPEEESLTAEERQIRNQGAPACAATGYILR